MALEVQSLDFFERREDLDHFTFVDQFHPRNSGEILTEDFRWKPNAHFFYPGDIFFNGHDVGVEDGKVEEISCFLPLPPPNRATGYAQNNTGAGDGSQFPVVESVDDLCADAIVLDALKKTGKHIFHKADIDLLAICSFHDAVKLGGQRAAAFHTAKLEGKSRIMETSFQNRRIKGLGKKKIKIIRNPVMEIITRQGRPAPKNDLVVLEPWGKLFENQVKDMILCLVESLCHI